MTTRESVSAVNRFGLGAAPGQLARIDDPRGWLHAQLHGDAGQARYADLPASLDYLRREADYYRERQAARRQGGQADPVANFGQRFREDQLRELGRRYRLAVASEQGFVERLVRFWSNHFAISIDKRAAALYAAPMEREAIRPHVLSRYADLLIAVESHPGMLRYLDNVRSIGADSMLAQRARRRRARADTEAPRRELGLNENLAREILELHTLGVDGGYTQRDVTELARAITGWGVPLPRELAAGSASSAFVFRAAAHEDGARNVVGRRYADDGLAQGRAILSDLAVHPSTARHLSYKLARHFVGDAPPPALVARLSAAWQGSGGDLPTVYAALIDAPEAWGEDARKFKTPDDFVISALRAGGAAPSERPRALIALLARMGQPPFTPRSPAGYADEAAEWSGPDALWKRVQAAQSLSESAPDARVDPLATAQAVFADRLDADTLGALRRAESPRGGLALLFASPAFQWRS
ncbi:DUF1800 domain-containing protein [Lysobacter sp. cf310]|uniref:DUF1800 domain-containing protein n=1 Tax=Lysobacter sp. cf310 TaxID=1761790 RepID=UPI0008EAD872|nr:DUF1800 domain-containing protein [Lysobacter sp. cf310]SFL19481.1 Uncharacterized conserved protein, DUF1800 family [Lysobacter sp. cf310]